MSQRYQGRHVSPAPTARPWRGKAVLAAAAGAGLVVPVVATASPASAASDSTWDRLASCESGGNWSTNTGNSFYGGLQFTRGTWLGYGGGSYADRADHASRSQQIAVANRVLAGQGWGAWPACSKKLGLRGLPTTGGPTEAPVSEKKTETKVEKKATKKATTRKSTRSTVSEPAARTAQPTRKVARDFADRVASLKAPKAVRSAAPVSGSVYVVKAGDTLNKIAAAQGVNGGWSSLYAANTSVVDDPDLIFVGEKLALPA